MNARFRKNGRRFHIGKRFKLGPFLVGLINPPGSDGRLEDHRNMLFRKEVGHPPRLNRINEHGADLLLKEFRASQIGCG